MTVAEPPAPGDARPPDPFAAEVDAIVHARHRDPFAVLGPHRVDDGLIIRAIQPSARTIDVRLVATGELLPMTPRAEAGLFEVRLPLSAGSEIPDYRLRITFLSAHLAEIDDPYRYGQVFTAFDLHLFGEGNLYRAFERFGSHRIAVGSTTVWSARRLVTGPSFDVVVALTIGAPMVSASRSPPMAIDR